MTFLRALWSPPLRWAWGGVVATFALLVLCDYLAVAPVGSQRFLHMKMPFILGSLPALGAVLLLPVAFFWPRRDVALIAWWLVCAAFLAAVFLGTKAGYAVRMSAFDRLAERSTMLVQAIRRYEEEHGRPPEALEGLVPKYLPSVPSTGMMGYPQYVYHQGPEVASRYVGNVWILKVPASNGFSSWDEFLYFPLQNYPATGYGGELEGMRDWAYLHE